MSLLSPTAPSSALSTLSDVALLARQESLVTERRRVDAELATVAAEIARRSRREAGFGGLAQRLGYSSPERFVAATTGVTDREAAALVRVGALLADTAAAPDAATAGAVGSPAGAPNAELARAVSAGDVSVLAADQELRAAGHDAGRIADRERELRGRRTLRLIRQEDGMTRMIGLLEPESAAIVVGAIDAAIAPRRMGAAGAAGAGDDRTRDQIAVDALVQLVQLAGQVAPDTLLGGRLPAVRLHVTGADLVSADVTGRIEGVRRGGSAAEPGRDGLVAAGTVHRLICAQGTIPVLFDDGGQVLNLGRTQRRFTAKQRIALAARDGGCRWPGCDRPPSWCEAHHIDEWMPTTAGPMSPMASCSAASIICTSMIAAGASVATVPSIGPFRSRRRSVCGPASRPGGRCDPAALRRRASRAARIGSSSASDPRGPRASRCR